ncbi:MAG: ParB/RepB/Spo0J family partition protein [Bacteroidales bacterium]|nr:ParB/RepB/Spo0J family partition protein [Bacteroidales bacterium]MBN2763776.1 ParB/RepB/Spo0J family partition protein [Bacteroidales bacterium]
MVKKSVLGRGLGALIEDPEPQVELKERVVGGAEIPVDSIDMNPFQPRSHFDQASLEELAESIRSVGVIQPITVRENGSDSYQLITGERRLRAARIAGLETIPAFIRKANDQGMLEMALVENIQREDLNAIEIALTYQRLVEECELTQESLSQRVGKKRATVANYLRLLKLPAEIQLGIRNEKITMGHARTLVGIEDHKSQLKLYYRIIDEELSVRTAEELSQKLQAEAPEETVQNAEPDNNTRTYEELKNHLAGFFNTSVDFKRNAKGSGKIIISFNSDDELERIIGIFDRLKS